MKGIAIVVTAFVLVAGGLNISFSKTEDTATINLSMDDPERAARAAGMILDEVADTVINAVESAETLFDSANPAEPTLYRIRNAANEPASQIGAYYDLDAAKRECLPGYCIFDRSGKLIYAG